MISSYVRQNTKIGPEDIGKEGVMAKLGLAL